MWDEDEDTSSLSNNLKGDEIENPCFMARHRKEP